MEKRKEKNMNKKKNIDELEKLIEELKEVNPAKDQIDFYLDSKKNKREKEKNINRLILKVGLILIMYLFLSYMDLIDHAESQDSSWWNCMSGYQSLIQGK